MGPALLGHRTTGLHSIGVEMIRPMSVELSERHRRHLRRLESESIYILREAAALFQRPVLLYSVGKDSSVLLKLAQKAFRPERIPFPVLHIDTTWKFREMIEFRNRVAEELELDLIVHTNREALDQGLNPIDSGSRYTDLVKTKALRDALDKYKFDAAIGGARRDEERSRAKERVFSVRSNHGWDPRAQRPELGNLFNGTLAAGQSMRIFPLSNWTELDVWRYVAIEEISIVSLYFSRPRPTVIRKGAIIMVDDERLPLNPGETPEPRSIRFRTLGCYPLSGAVVSEAATLPQIIAEMEGSKVSERQGRLIDTDQAASMEKKKLEGYF